MKSAKKWKILLHSMTFKRDFGSAYILSSLLKQLGCECFLSNNTNYLSLPVRLWNPDAVVYVTYGRTEKINNVFPDIKLFLWCGEGGENYEHSAAPHIIRSKFLYKRISKTYLWSERGSEHILRAIEESPDKSFLGNMEQIKDKFPIVANPRVDLIRYSSPSQNKSGKVRIGLIGTFSNINSPIYTKESLLGFILMHIDSKTILVHEDAISQIRLLKCFHDIIGKLDPEKYEISLRPYPLEPVDKYMNSPYFKSGRVKVNDYIDFSSWLNEQDIIIGMTSSTICQIAMAKKSFINMDFLVERNQQCLDLIPKELVEISRKISPKSYDEVFKIIENYNEFKLDSNYIDDSLDKLYHSKIGHSANLQVAKDTVEFLEKNCTPAKSYIPYNAMVRIDDIRMRYAEFRNKKHMATDYSFFRFKKIQIQAKKEFDPVVYKIMNAPENQFLLR